MKIFLNIFLIVAVVFPCGLNGQSGTPSSVRLVEAMGGLPVDYTLTTLDEPLGVVDQFLIKRAGVIDDDDEGMGYESWHLGIVFRNGIQRPEDRSDFQSQPNDNIRLIFYDINGQEIGRRYLHHQSVKAIFNGRSSGLYHYEIDLRNVPVSVLELAERIDLAQRRNWPLHKEFNP
ncbi:MAG: hypothetical protein AAFN65_03005 [Bacteroidota bacterium]